jgi:hypothetical protein
MNVSLNVPGRKGCCEASRSSSFTEPLSGFPDQAIGSRYSECLLTIEGLESLTGASRWRTIAPIGLIGKSHKVEG